MQIKPPLNSPSVYKPPEVKAPNEWIFLADFKMQVYFLPNMSPFKLYLKQI